MVPKLARDLFSTGTQLVVNQAFGLVALYIVSISLSKTEFAELNFALAVLLTAFAALSLGTDQLVLRKIAQGAEPAEILPLQIGHLLIAGLVFYTVALASTLFGGRDGSVTLLLLLGVGKFAGQLTAPLKSVVNAQQRFAMLGVLSVVSSVCKGVGLLFFSWYGLADFSRIVQLFIWSDLAEFACMLVFFQRVVGFRALSAWRPGPYLALVKEALPQAGTVIMTALLARFDWIALHLFTTPAQLAEYSFASKAVEMAGLPLLVFSPLLIPKIAGWMRRGAVPEQKISLLLLAELTVATLSALLLVTAWVPVLHAFSLSRYGAVNQLSVLIMALVLPLTYVNNFLWSALFTQGKLRVVFKYFAGAAAINVLLNVALTHRFGAHASAMAFTAAAVFQFAGFLWSTTIVSRRRILRELRLHISAAGASGLAAWLVAANTLGAVAASLVLYLGLIVLFRGRLVLRFIKQPIPLQRRTAL